MSETSTTRGEGNLAKFALVRVVAPHFVAGLVMEGDRCIEAAPILRWTVGKDRAELRAYFARKGWAASVIYGPNCGTKSG